MYRLSDASEFMNIAKDDVLAFPKVVHRDYPPTVTAAMSSVVKPFVCKSLEVNNTCLRVFGRQLGLPEGSLEALHTQDHQSGSEARLIRVPPMPEKVLQDRPTIGAHSDFGSLVSVCVLFSFFFTSVFSLFCTTFWGVCKCFLQERRNGSMFGCVTRVTLVISH